jgi:hypothetical protein
MEEWKPNSKIYFQCPIIPATFAPGFLWNQIKATFFEGYFYCGIDTFTRKEVFAQMDTGTCPGFIQEWIGQLEG